MQWWQTDWLLTGGEVLGVLGFLVAVIALIANERRMRKALKRWMYEMPETFTLIWPTIALVVSVILLFFVIYILNRFHLGFGLSVGSFPAALVLVILALMSFHASLHNR